jgi:hypothetical protein
LIHISLFLPPPTSYSFPLSFSFSFFFIFHLFLPHFILYLLLASYHSFPPLVLLLYHLIIIIFSAAVVAKSQERATAFSITMPDSLLEAEIVQQCNLAAVSPWARQTVSQ